MIKAIIFDLDGTLLDTLEDLTDSVNHVLRSHGMPERTLDEIRSFIGNGVPTLIARSVPEGTDAETVSICVTEMHGYYREHSDIKTKPYDGIVGMLDELKKLNIDAAVVTNKVEDAAKILCTAKFGDVFGAVIGDNGKDRLKPAPDNVFRAMKMLETEKNEVIYVGDSDVDMITASNVGLESIGVLWGFRDETSLRNSGAVHIAKTPSDIIGIAKERILKTK